MNESASKAEIELLIKLKHPDPKTHPREFIESLPTAVTRIYYAGLIDNRVRTSFLVADLSNSNNQCREHHIIHRLREYYAQR